ncbi:uncharacterized protein LOC128132662 isoform X2 [Lactuca sativa]|uniref:uncharacterized protein LOC128132662 isoform X2 n=1 Tax=Lactuca sativa TaxID=4236 RepID=UPI0022B07EE5|nr:uncharacterized protein LOC128132662 isoform X2 [Lactuca sativa]
MEGLQRYIQNLAQLLDAWFLSEITSLPPLKCFYIHCSVIGALIYAFFLGDESHHNRRRTVEAQLSLTSHHMAETDTGTGKEDPKDEETKKALVSTSLKLLEGSALRINNLIDVATEGGMYLNRIDGKNNPNVCAYRMTPEASFPVEDVRGYYLSSPITFTLKPKESIDLDLELRFDIPFGLNVMISTEPGQSNLIADGMLLEANYRKSVKIHLKNETPGDQTILPGEIVARCDTSLA